MSSGRPDYWYGMLPGFPTPGINQNDWSLRGHVIIPAYEMREVCAYTVPVGYVLYLVGGVISCEDPGINKALFNYGAGLTGVVYYDTTFVLPLTPSGSFVVLAGESISIELYNYSGVASWFGGVLIGYREYKIV